MKRAVFWKNPAYKKGKPLRGIIEKRFLVVGAGISGLSLAYFLLERGVKAEEIAIVEATTVGDGSTGRSAGILIPEIETEKNVGWDELIVRYGLPLAKTYRRSYLDALASIEQLIKKGNIACDAQKGDFLILARTSEAKEVVRNDIRARKLMGEHPRALRGVHLMNEFGSPGFVFAERDVKALSVNPLALAQGIATYLRSKGVAIFEDSPLISTFGATARFSRGAITFKKIIYARGVGENHKDLHKFVTSIAVSNKLEMEELEELRLADLNLFIDEEGEHSFHYGKVTADGRLLLGYGDVRVRTRVAATQLHEAHLRNIKNFLKTMFPKTRIAVAYAWSGVYAIGSRMLPIISFSKHAVTVNGAGIQLGSVAAAHYVAAKLLEKRHPLDPLFKPGTYAK